MALQSSGTISMTQIYAEVTQVAHNGSTSFSLHNMALTADQYGGGFNVITPTSMSEFYGWAYYIPPTVETVAATNVDSSSAQLNGNVTSWGSYAPDKYGFYFGTSSTCTSNTRYEFAANSGISTFNNVFNGLSASTAYYFCAFAKVVGQSDVIGDTLGFSTTAAVICYGMSIAKSTSGAAACTGSFRTYKINTYSFSTATSIWAGTDDCTGAAQSAGYFSDGIIWRYWNGSSFTTSGNCNL